MDHQPLPKLFQDKQEQTWQKYQVYHILICTITQITTQKNLYIQILDNLKI